MKDKNTDSSSNENKELSGVTAETADEASDLVSGLAGRDLDVAVAERVMNISCSDDRTPDHSKWCNCHGKGERVGAPFYSRDIDRAMEVVFKMQQTHCVEIWGGKSKGWHVCFEPNSFRRAAAGGPDLPDVICRAALAAIEATNQHAEGGTTDQD